MTSIVFTGDIAFSGKFKDTWKSEFIDPEIIQFLCDADYVVANVESPITTQTANSKKTPSHVSSPDSVSRLMEMNANIWNLSNNHIFDCGEKGVMDTIEVAQQYGCMTVGAGKSLTEASEPLLLGNEEKIGIISISKPWKSIRESHMVFTWDKEEIIKERIVELKKMSNGS